MTKAYVCCTLTINSDYSHVHVLQAHQHRAEIPCNGKGSTLNLLHALEEVRWLIIKLPYPTKVYTNYKALVLIL